MLSRTADHLFWMSRYTERAENTARMLDVNYQTSLLPQSAAVAQVGWQGMLSISELLPAYIKKHHEVTPAGVMEFMVSDESNPSSIISLPSRRPRERARRAWHPHHRGVGDAKPDLVGTQPRAEAKQF
jgi:uncharacterized alpha-E superfamily protein